MAYLNVIDIYQLTHYYLKIGGLDERRRDIISSRERLLEEDLLSYDGPNCSYTVTPRGEAYLASLRLVPLPESVISWKTTWPSNQNDY